ncbi:hypothetical protein GK047_13300 [Paenibacillus sp. SYP-B3998]|uniref:Uncharacterized protein n=1 Tax=Paenibacillus sp. SYP-B3998 TaxID=2678564 RepID=A0A6G3ZZH6_9BACL|nr:hypothetical protein [Paenibacillus sp. SYP-B3998]NEW06981.1 hypothetical protein [Paenibacillus sp. SYP-B3998]
MKKPHSTSIEFTKQQHASLTSYHLNQHTNKTIDLLKQLHHFRVRGQQQQKETFQYLSQTVQQVSLALNQISQSLKTYTIIDDLLQQIEIAERQLEQEGRQQYQERERRDLSFDENDENQVQQHNDIQNEFYF